MKRAAAVLGALTLSACTAFPPHGTGGFAEHQRYTHAHAYPRAFTRVWDHPSLRWQRVNLQMVNCIDWQLAEMRQHGANEVYPAQMWIIEQQHNRVLRLFAAGMGWDGEREVQKLQDMMQELDERLIIQSQIKIDLRRHPEKIKCGV